MTVAQVEPGTFPAGLNTAVMLAGFVLVMGALAVGLRLHRRTAPGSRPAPARRGPAALARHVGATVAGGYVLLQVVVLAYYYGVARLGGNFLLSALAGCAVLLALALPLFAAASWITEIRARRRRDARP